MPTLLVFAGSNSSTSINHQLVRYLTTQLKKTSFDLVSLANLEIEMYSEDAQRDKGFPASIQQLYKQIQASGGLLISVNEHNGNPSAFFKNILDWLSRLDKKFLEGKKIVLFSTSPGARGGVGSLEVVKQLLPRFGAELVATYSLPSFQENFSSSEQKICNQAINQEVTTLLAAFEALFM